MIETWRWYGPKDPVTLTEIKQTGASGIVTALHHIPNGEIWTVDEIQKRQTEIESYGLKWSVVESVPVHEDIKKQTGDFQRHIENYKVTLQNLGECGIETVCYNFMPVLDWARTDVKFPYSDGSYALMFDPVAFAAFDLFILKRPDAETGYKPEMIEKAKSHFNSLSKEKSAELTGTILQGLPGSEESFSLDEFQQILDEYKNIDEKKLTEHLHYFIREINPTAESAGVRMAIHPDDPPWPLLGLPRVMSTLENALNLINVVDSPSNGITLCTGSFGAGHFNNLVEIAKNLAHRINFVHLRNVHRKPDGYFMEANHLNGDIDMYNIVKVLLEEQHKREKEGRTDRQIPMRPDHGHLMLDDIKKAKTYPGYSLIGRMKGLAELRGLQLGIEKTLYPDG
jgi:mannonate dehydratase